MVETYYAGAYWGARKESPEECAHRLQAFLQALSHCDDSLSRWYQPARSRRKAMGRPLPSEARLLAEMLRHDVNRAEGDQGVIEELGFYFSADNCEPEGDSAHLDIHCGGYSEYGHNRCVVSLPHSGPNAQRVLTTRMLMELVRGMATAWEPDWAIAMSDTHRDIERSHHAPRSPYVAWITYLSHRRGMVPPLPAPARVEHVGSLGTLIALTTERFTASNPEHLVFSKRIREMLDRAGLLGSM